MEPNIILFLLVVGTLLLVPLIVLTGWLLRARASGGVPWRRVLAATTTVGVSLAVVAIVLVRAAGTPAAEAIPAGAPLPTSLAGLTLEHRATGAEAMAQLTQLHGQDLAVIATETVSYTGSEGTAQVWVGWAPSEDDAHRLASEMTRAMRDGTTPFTTPARQLDGTWAAEGMGQSHRYFASGTGVWWIAADTSVLGPALTELLALAGSPH